MKNRIMTLEQAYRYVLRRVDWKTKRDTMACVSAAKNNEKYMFCAWDSVDAMMFFIEQHGKPFVVDLQDGTYKKV